VVIKKKKKQILKMSVSFYSLLKQYLCIVLLNGRVNRKNKIQSPYILFSLFIQGLITQLHNHLDKDKIKTTKEKVKKKEKKKITLSNFGIVWQS